MLSCKTFSYGSFLNFAIISSTLGPQNPPWHLPIPVSARLLIPSSETGGTGELSASIISPSVMVSQRQITLPYAGFSLISRFFSSDERFLNLIFFVCLHIRILFVDLNRFP